MLKLNHVKKAYGDFHLDCSFDVLPGRITGIIGRNGSGKSTSFKAILGLIHYDGKIENTWDKEEIGVVLSDSSFSGWLKIKDLQSILKNMYTNFDEEFYTSLIQRFNLDIHKKIKELSTGMKVKLKMAVALSHKAKLLILDEPTAGLDVVVRDEILDLLREYMDDDTSILISSHIANDLETLCDDVYMIDEGKIIFHEETDVLLSDYALLKVNEEEFKQLDHAYILRYKKENYGYSCLTNQKQFYCENYPKMIVEKGSIDQVILMLTKGKCI